MKDILSKLSTYNLFNYLFPGILFVIVASKVTHYSLIQQDVVIGVFLYYFIGLVVSRFGSLVIEPILRKTSFLRFADYKGFVAALKKDEKLELLSEVNNTYRTLCSLFTLLLLLKLYEVIETKLPFLAEWNALILLVLLLVMFLLSCRKQTGYITKRIKANYN
jgi:hypothetical protein